MDDQTLNGESQGLLGGGRSKSRLSSTYQRMIAELRGRRYLDLEKDSQFSEAWMILGVMLTLGGLLLNIQFMLAMAVILFVVAAAGWLWNELSLFGLHYQRHFSERRAFLGETIELTLEVRNQKFLPLTWLQITDVFPAYLPMDQGQVVINPASNQGEYLTFWMPGAFQRLRRNFTFHCTERGYHVYGPIAIRTGDGFGLFTRRAKRDNREHIIVYPRIYSAAEMRLPAKNPFGDRSAERHIFEDPMRTKGIREWQPGDGLRRIHWKATARHRQMLSRIYEPSEDAQILIFLNVSTMRRAWQGIIPELMERAISVAGSLAAMCVEMRLPVGLIANGFLPGSDQTIRLLPGRSPKQLMHILELLAAVTPLFAQPIEELLLREAPQLPWGATMVVVTALVHDELLATLSDLAQAGRQIVLFTLAKEPPVREVPGILVYHLPHLVEDLIAPKEVVV
jgi:uncharacterized protein (DUF58 family)